MSLSSTSVLEPCGLNSETLSQTAMVDHPTRNSNLSDVHVLWWQLANEHALGTAGKVFWSPRKYIY